LEATIAQLRKEKQQLLLQQAGKDRRFASEFEQSTKQQRELKKTQEQVQEMQTQINKMKSYIHGLEEGKKREEEKKDGKENSCHKALAQVAHLRTALQTDRQAVEADLSNFKASMTASISELAADAVTALAVHQTELNAVRSALAAAEVLAVELQRDSDDSKAQAASTQAKKGGDEEVAVRRFASRCKARHDVLMKELSESHALALASTTRVAHIKDLSRLNQLRSLTVERDSALADLQTSQEVRNVLNFSVATLEKLLMASANEPTTSTTNTTTTTTRGDSGSKSRVTSAEASLLRRKGFTPNNSSTPNHSNNPKGSNNSASEATAAVAVAKLRRAREKRLAVVEAQGQRNAGTVLACGPHERVARDAVVARLDRRSSATLAITEEQLLAMQAKATAALSDASSNTKSFEATLAQLFDADQLLDSGLLTSS
jgi:hypothetical protein